jgi:5-keto 4-deoxyuronate isomerase
MDIRQPDPQRARRTLDTAGLRRHFLVEQMFQCPTRRR